MKCPQCGHEQTLDPNECPRCGVVFAKLRHRKEDSHPETVAPSSRVHKENPEPQPPRLYGLLFAVPSEVNPVAWSLRLLLLIVLTYWGLRFIFSSIGSAYTLNSFWHLVNLPFHEAGHIFWRPFGRLLTSLGGSLMQVLMPAICLVVFLVKTRDPFAGAFSLWWTGQNFIDIAPYIDDARSLSLPLLGGNVGKHAPYGFHDWEFILKETGLIRFDHTLARLSHAIGSLLIAAALAWGAWLLFRQYGVLTHRSRE